MLWQLALLEDASSRDVLRVVQYDRLPPVLEKRHQYRHGSEAWRNGKVRGLTGLDFATAVQHMEEFETPLLTPWKSVRAGTEGESGDSPPA